MRLILDRVNDGLARAGDLIFNCQMGRGRTTTGMVLAGLVATVLYGDYKMEKTMTPENEPKGYEIQIGNGEDGVSEEEAYLNGSSLFLSTLEYLLIAAARNGSTTSYQWVSNSLSLVPFHATICHTTRMVLTNAIPT